MQRAFVIAVVAAAVVLLFLMKRSKVGGKTPDAPQGGGEGPQVAPRPESSERMDILERAFEAGTVASDGRRRIELTTQNIGNLKCTSGQLLACDPLVLMDDKPFVRTVRPGEYPVELSIAHRGTDERVAFARLRFSAEKAAKWELAVVPGQNVSELKADEIFGYGVDSGTGSFMDLDSVEELKRRMRVDPSYYEQLCNEMKKTYKHTREWALIDDGKLNLAIFSSGDGDGRYASYWGLSAAGEVVSLTTDFVVVVWSQLRLDRRPSVSRYGRRSAHAAP